MLIKERKDPMTKYDGYMGKVLTIDLKDKTTSLYPWSEEDRQLYLGGKIMAAKIISDNVKPCVDAFMRKYLNYKYRTFNWDERPPCLK